LILASCGALDGSPSPSAAAPAGTGQPIVIGLPVPSFAESPFFTISNAGGYRVRPREIVPQLVYNALYRYDDTLAPIPDLAAAPCEVRADQVTIICRLVEATFHNGAPLTAEDVAFTFELGRRHPDCLFAFGECFGEMLQTATAVDARTVEFRLTAPNATFLTLVLPNVFIDSRAVVEAAYAPLAERAATLELDAADFQQGADAIFAQLGSDSADCEAPLADAAELFEAAGSEPLPRDQFADAEGRFDACLYAEWTAILLEDIAASLGATGLDAISLAYRALSFNRSPVGTGPWRFISVEDGTRLTLKAFDAYHRGPPATPSIEVRLIRDFGIARDGLLSGELDWVPLPPDLYSQIQGAPDLRFSAYPDSTYFMLAYNLREGMLFADRVLRDAVEVCIDKPATVDAATDGTGDVIYTPVEPVSWAYQADLPRPERDVDEARRAIEAAGWVEGDDRIYVRDGVRLATDVYVRGDEGERVAFMDLVAEQVRDCGIELTVIPADTETVLSPLQEYPHIPGGHDEPFQAVFIGWQHGLDPHDRLWHSRTVTSAEQPNAENVMGFSNPQVDALLDAGITTYDQRERARIYREFQQVLVEQRPVLFGWAARIHEAIDARLGLTEGELNLSSRQWFWQLEKLVLREAGSG